MTTNIAYEDQLHVFTTAWKLGFVGRLAFDKATGVSTNGLIVDRDLAVTELTHACDIPLTERRLRTTLATFKHLEPPFPSSEEGAKAFVRFRSRAIAGTRPLPAGERYGVRA
jgi:hypothetical protein